MTPINTTITTMPTAMTMPSEGLMTDCGLAPARAPKIRTINKLAITAETCVMPTEATAVAAPTPDRCKNEVFTPTALTTPGAKSA